MLSQNLARINSGAFLSAQLVTPTAPSTSAGLDAHQPVQRGK